MVKIINLIKEEKLQEYLSIKFKNLNNLHQALIHRSFVNENPGEEQTNERLEFLGDAILEFVVSNYLFQEFKTQDEGHLTALRSKLVNTTALSKVAIEIGLGNLLYLSKGEEKSGGRENNSLLANTVEATIGAIFIDQGIKETENFIKRFILSKIPDVVKKSLKDPKSLLQEFVQASGFPAPIYKTVSETGPDHAKRFVIAVFVNKDQMGEGEGTNKQEAQQNAAQRALEVWKNR